MCTPGTLVSVRGTQAAKSSRWAFASVARVCHRLPSPRDGRRLGQKTRRVSLEFGSERACAPPALSALNLGRLLRVVLHVKRDCSADNPISPGDYSSCALEEEFRACPALLAQRFTQAQRGLPGCTTGGAQW